MPDLEQEDGQTVFNKKVLSSTLYKQNVSPFSFIAEVNILK